MKAISIDGTSEGDEDDYAALDRLNTRVNVSAHMTRIKDRDK